MQDEWIQNVEWLIKGAKGNIEYLVLLKKGAADEERLREDVPAAVVEQAHSDLKNKAD